MLILVTSAGRTAPQSAPGQREPSPSPPAAASANQWAPNLLYDMLSSPNPEAGGLLYRAAFAAGPAIIPKLQAALTDDRTATFAARCLAYIGGAQALDILSRLVGDPRNLDLRRFYYGALGESDDPQATAVLLGKLRASDREPDRSVTQDAILALSIRSDAALVPQLRAIAKEVTDPVIQDDIENAADIIEARARYLAAHPEGRSSPSLSGAIHTYFIPGLEGAPPAARPGTGSAEGPAVDVRIASRTFSPDKARVLTHVIFETPQALANYEIVLQKKAQGWAVASVWLGSEARKTRPTPQPSQGATP